MYGYDRVRFGETVKNDYASRRRLDIMESKSLRASAMSELETQPLGHPSFAHLGVGERSTAPMVAAFLDLTNFTGRTFWDDPEETVDLAHAVLTGFIEIVSKFGGHPLGLRGDGLFAGFSPGDPAFTGAMALAACAFALDAVQSEINPWLEQAGIDHIQARAGLDYGDITFVRTGSHESSEINPLGFAANFAAKCEKTADSWEIVAGEGLVDLLPNQSDFVQHEKSPKRYTRDYQTRNYRFYDYRWRRALPHLPGVPEYLDGRPTSSIYPS